MTREEFHRKVKCNDSYIGWHNAHELADELYDDFESRVCKNCKHMEKDGHFYVCKQMYHQDSLAVTQNFGCNKWERKQDE